MNDGQILQEIKFQIDRIQANTHSIDLNTKSGGPDYSSEIRSLQTHIEKVEREIKTTNHYLEEIYEIMKKIRQRFLT